MKRRWLFPWALGTLAALAGARVHRRFRKDLRAAWERIEAGGRVMQTARGAIEYGEAGRGSPVLLIHGAGGGYDHALLAGQFILEDGYRMIAASRFGYLRSPPAQEANPATQADLWESPGKSAAMRAASSHPSLSTGWAFGLRDVDCWPIWGFLARSSRRGLCKSGRRPTRYWRLCCP
jgi:pimeloyl-ACP methyl ester carboxylesterase